MKRSAFSDEHIIGILKEQEAAAVTANVCRRHRISEAMVDNAALKDISSKKWRRPARSGMRSLMPMAVTDRASAGRVI